MTQNLVGIVRKQSINFVIDFDSEILILILEKKKSEKVCGTKLNFMSIINMYNITL